MAVDRVERDNSVPLQGNLTFRRVAAILISWLIEVAGSDDPQRISACLLQFDLVLNAGQRATGENALVVDEARYPASPAPPDPAGLTIAVPTCGSW
ncbi:hypothetical protein AB0E54_40790, partial [Amycolatopsis coloradensis]